MSIFTVNINIKTTKIMKKETINKNQLRLVKGGQHILTTTSIPQDPCPKCLGRDFLLLSEGPPLYEWMCMTCGSITKSKE